MVRSLLFFIFSLGLAAPASALDGVVFLPDGRPAADSIVSILGHTGSTRTGADGRFTWYPDPAPPFEVLVILPGGVYTQPVVVEALPPPGTPVEVRIRATVSEAVTVSAGATPHTEAPPASAASVLARQEIEQRRPTNLAETLDGMAGVGRLEDGHSAVPSIRGLARGRTLILIDGARVTAERRAGPSATFLDPFFLEAVEVSRGFGSVAYGSDAFGGVIHARTRQAVPDAPAGARVQATMGAGLPERSLGVEAFKGLGEGGVIVQGRLRDFGDYRSARGRVPDSAARDRGLRARFDHEAGPGRLYLDWQSDAGREIGKPSSDWPAARSYYPSEDSHRFGVGYDPDPGAGFTRLSVQAFAGRYRLVTDREQTAAGIRQLGRSDVAAWDWGFRVSGARPVAGWRLEGGVDLNGRTGVRADGRTDVYDPAGAVLASTTETSIESAGRRDLGAYLTADGVLLQRLTAAAGVRADSVSAHNDGGFFGDRGQAHQARSGFVAVTAGPLAGTTATAQVGWGFRDPTLSDRYFRGFTGRGFATGNPDLTPERSLQYELALRRGGRVRTGLYLYRYRIAQLVERYRAGDDFFFRSRGTALIRGIELEARADLGAGYSAELALQASEGHAVEDGSPLADIPPEGLTLALRKAVGERGWAHLRSMLRTRDRAAGPTEREIPGYALFEAGFGWRWSRRLEARLVFRNLTDRAYYQTPDEVSVLAPGRSALVTVSAAF